MMKMKILIPIGILLLSVLGCTKKSASVEVAIVGDGGDSLLYVMRPYDGFVTGVTDTIRVVLGDNNLLTIDLNDTAPIMIQSGANYYRLIAEPGGAYKLTFDYTQNGIAVCSDSAQVVYDKIFEGKNIYKYEFVRDYTVFPLDTVASKMKANFEKLMSDDLASLQKTKMSDRRRKFMETDIRLFWLTSLTKVLRANYFLEQRTQTPMYPGYMDVWGDIYKKHPAVVELAGSNYFRDYVSLWFTYTNGYREVNSVEEYWKNKFNPVFEHIKDKRMRNTLLAQFLYFECLNNKTMNPAILEYIDKFKAEFPKSGHIPLLDKFVIQIQVFNEKIKSGFAEGVRFVENSDEIATFKALTAQFEGKPVFIDFWFSSCGPCVKQFAWSKPLHQFLADNGIEMLYVSIDRNKPEWENGIKYYGLDGWHIKATQSLHKDLYENYKINLFPTYMLIDKKGEIVLNRAMEPEKGEALYQQIKSALN